MFEGAEEPPPQDREVRPAQWGASHGRGVALRLPHAALQPPGEDVPTAGEDVPTPGEDVPIAPTSCGSSTSR